MTACEYMGTRADIDAWAQSVAAALSPLTPDEAAAVGRLAAVLDGKSVARKVGEAA